MANYYVATTGSDASDGSLGKPWRTWGHAVSIAVAGDIVNFYPGTYAEAVVLSHSGAIGNVITFQRVAGQVGEVLVDGTGNNRAFDISAVHDITLIDIAITNNGGIAGVSTQVVGLGIGDSNTGATSQGSARITLTRVHVHDVNRNSRSDCLGTPVVVYSNGDETMGGTATRNIEFDTCLLEHSLIERGDGAVSTGYLAITGNVKDLYFHDSTIDNTGIAVVSNGQNGIDTGGNVFPLANPTQPRQLVILRNTFRNTTTTAVYGQAIQSSLIAQNTFINCSFGIGFVTENSGSVPPGAPNYGILLRCWARDNLFINTTNSEFFAGAFGALYDDVSNVQFSNNTIWRTGAANTSFPILLLGNNQGTPGKFGIIGQSRVINNIVIAPGNLLETTLPAGSTIQLNYNLYGSNGATPFVWQSGAPVAFPYAAGQDTAGLFQAYATANAGFEGPLGDPSGYHLLLSSWASAHGTGGHTPNWYTTGLFGVYDPIVEYDVYSQRLDPASLSVGGAQFMSKPYATETLRVGTPTDNYDVIRVVADPRSVKLAANLGTIAEYVGAQGVISLQKYVTWDTGWRPVGGGPLYPKTATDFANATKITPSALYLIDAMTGNLFDASGNGNTLTLAGTAFKTQQILEGRTGAFFSTTDGVYQANVNDPAANSFVFGTVVAYISNVGGGGFNNAIARLKPVTNSGFAYWFTGAGGLTYLIADAGAAHSFSAAFPGAPNFAATPIVPYLLTGQLDRTAGHFRGRISRNGASVATLDIAVPSLGSLSEASQLFAFGALNGGALAGGAWNGYGFFATGVQCEGSNVLRDLAVGLGWEV